MTSRTFPLIDPGRVPQALLLVLAVLPPVVTAGALTFALSDAPLSERVALYVLLLIPLAVSALMLYLIAGLRRSALEITAAGLRLITPLYGRRIAWPDLDLNAARVVALDAEPELRPRWRTNGVGLPGFRSGWFRLRNHARPPRAHRQPRRARADPPEVRPPREPGGAGSVPRRPARRRACLSVRRRCRRSGRPRRRGRDGCRRARRARGRAWQ